MRIKFVILKKHNKNYDLILQSLNNLSLTSVAYLLLLYYKQWGVSLQLNIILFASDKKMIFYCILLDVNNKLILLVQMYE